MRLTLTNFKSYEDKVIDLPNSGMVLLAGKSEAGKSSILNAIYFALYGDKKVKPVRWGTVQCKVVLEWKGVTITRTGGRPTRLMVKGGGIDLEDDEAQGYINTHFCDRARFSIGSYIMQGENDCILTATPAEQLRLLHSLAFGDDISHVVLARNINAKIRELECDIAKVEVELPYMKKALEELSIELETFSVDEIDPAKLKRAQQFLSKVPLTMKAAEDKRVKLESDLEEQRRFGARLESIVSQEEGILSNLEKMKEVNMVKLNEDREKAKDELASLRYRLDKMMKLKQLAEKKKILEENIAHLPQVEIVSYDEMEEARRESYEICERQQAYLDLHNILKDLPFSIETDDGKLQKFSAFRNKLNEYVGPGHAMTCPGCELSLKVVGEELAITTSEDSLTQKQWEVVLKTRRMIEGYVSWPKPQPVKESVKRVEELTAAAREYTTVTSKLEIYTKQLESLGEIPDIEEIDPANIEMLEEYLSSINEDIGKANSTNSSILNLKFQLEGIVREKSRITRLVNKDLNAEELTTVKANIEKWRRQEEIARKLVIDGLQNERLKGKREKVVKLTKDLSDKKAVLINLRKEVVLTHKLKDLVKKAQLTAIERVVSSINNNLCYYLEKMFEDPPTILLSTVEDVGSDMLSKLSTKIEYRGHDLNCGVSSVNFSGGARNRIVLASLLAVNDMLDSSIIMLDECLNNLDPEGNTDVFEFLREHAKGKLMLVCSHEAVQGIFEEVYSV